MKIDFSKLSGTNSVDTLLDPRGIFSALPEKDEKFTWARDVQSEVWKKWFEKRNEKNLIIKMNTGSGKTVVALLILKSCLNENKGPAVYVLPDPYLAKQALMEAKALGIDVTEDPQDLNFRRGRAILVTNIYKLINGHSIFGVRETYIQIGSIVIDDVHACLDTTEEQFTLKIPYNTELYSELFKIFRESLRDQSSTRLLELEHGDLNANILVPYWTWNEKLNEVRELLYKYYREEASKNDDYKSLYFVWPLIKENLELCNCVFGADYIEISPKFNIIDVFPSFINADRRIFMTATLSDDSILVSHFDVPENSIRQSITPDSSNDIGDRMILIPQMLNPNITNDDFKNYIKQISTLYNTVVIVPSNYRARYWEDVADLILRADNLYDGVEKLKSTHVGLAILVNKYDGIDLPGDACRILVIDGLPDMRRKIDKFEEGALQGSDSVIERKIQKIEQGMGRGVRSRDDYCVVFLMGNTLVDELFVKGAIDKFTPATSTQFKISEQLSAQVSSETLQSKDITELINYLLKRDKEWVSASKGSLASIKYNPQNHISEKIVKEREAFNFALNHQYQKAVNSIQEAINTSKDNREKGLLKQHLAEYYYFIDSVKSQEILLSARTLNRQILRPIEGIQYEKIFNRYKNQAQNIKEFYNEKFNNPNKFIISLKSVLENLIFQPETADKFEDAFCNLAFFIGFKGQRPEHTFNRGPDVLWAVGNLTYFVIECKNGATTELISKNDCNQLNGSINWFEEVYDDSCTQYPLLIHPSNCFEYSASPNQNIKIITKEKLELLKNKVLEFGKDLINNNNVQDETKINQLLNYHYLTPDKFISHFTTGFTCNRN